MADEHEHELYLAQSDMGELNDRQLGALVRRLFAKGDERPTLRHPWSAAMLMMPRIGKETREHFCVILVDTKKYVIEIETLYIAGTCTGQGTRDLPPEDGRRQHHCDQ